MEVFGWPVLPITLHFMGKSHFGNATEESLYTVEQ